MRPDEAAEEEKLYSPKLSVTLYPPLQIYTEGSRAEQAVQRYRAARRFNVDRERIFTAYLTFGGIQTVRPGM